MRKSLPLLMLVLTGTAWLVTAYSVPVRAQRGQPVSLPDGAGKEVVEVACVRCHALGQLTSSGGYTREGWVSLLSSMVALPQDQARPVTDYLTQHFPEKPRPPAVVIPGSAAVSIKEWMVPSLGSRPHDPLATRDGANWWTGMFATVLGRLDPKTGAMKEYALKTSQSGPHGLVEDASGNVWFTANLKGYIGKLNPATGEVTEYTLPDPKARGPHTPIFDQKGMLWFTLQSGMVGRLDPRSGEIRLASTPSPNTYPYGIVVNSNGVPFYVDFRGNRVGSIDPVTMVIREYSLPDSDARPRRIAITPDDIIWYTDYARGFLGRFDPKTGQVREWPSPGGRQSQPYGITAVGNILWYSESAVRPNTLVRFDSQTEKFQSWVIPSGGGVVRNMMANRAGNLVLACSGVNRVALVEVSKTGPSQ